MRSLTTSAVILGALTGLSACVQVTAPDKPIVINLNINIKQEVVYRLDGDAKDLINQEADIF
ncbi:MAG: YnbE family lipoprotein [Sphingopyxis sp.]|nr:MAG: YnbE family lipoprotein [Sphingopyxis sp.]